MSVDSAKQFIDRLKTDEQFRSKLVAESGKEQRAKIITEAGFDFTNEEYESAIDEVGEPISEDDLDDVAGGWCVVDGCKTDIF